MRAVETYPQIQVFYIAIVLYGPSLALSQVTGLHIWLAVGSCGLICTLYTSIVRCVLVAANTRAASIECRLGRDESGDLD